MMSLFLTFMCSWQVAVATESNNGTSMTTFYTLDTLETISYSFYGEGMAYDSKRDRFILGSLDFGTLLAVPRSTVPEKNIHYNAEGVTMLLNTRPEAFNGSNFLGLTMDPREGEDAVWGCISYGEYSTYGVARVNLTNNAVDFFDLTMLANPATGDKSVLNDLAFSPDGQFIFITDTWGYQIIRLTVATGFAEVWNNGPSFCSECLTTEPHFDGPNGIVYVSASTQGEDCAADGGASAHASQDSSDYLLIGLGSTSNRLLKVNATAAFLPPVEINVTDNAGILSQLDGLVLSSGDSSTLFAAGNGVNSIFALTSSDDWHTATLRATFNAHCPENQPSALVLVDNKDVVCYCTNGFGPAPYPLNILTQGPGHAVAEKGIKLSLDGMMGEGIEYDILHDRLVVGSMSTGAIRGVPSTAAANEVQLTASEVYTYFEGGGKFSINATVGLKVDPANSCLLWAAVKSIPIGVARIDICTAYQSSEPDLFVDLSQYANPEFGSSPNDITIMGNILYITDFQGGYVWRVNLADGLDLDDYAIEIFLSFDPSVERPNGIENINNSLLVSLMDSNTLKRVDVSSKETTSVSISPSDVYSSGDGLRFDATKEVLYVARHNDDSVLALVSCDGWSSAQVATDFLASCLLFISSPGVTTLALAGSDLWVFCSDDFGDGPYAFNRIGQSSSKVFSGGYACSGQDSNDPDVMPEESSDGDEDCNDSVATDPFFWVSLALFLALVVVLLLLLLVLVKNNAIGWGNKEETFSLDDNLLPKT